MVVVVSIETLSKNFLQVMLTVTVYVSDTGCYQVTYHKDGLTEFVAHHTTVISVQNQVRNI